jgi:hypothetical protein
MLSDYQYFALSQIGVFAFGALCAFALYFFASTARSILERLRGSAHGLWLGAAAAYAVAAAPFSSGSPFAWLVPFWVLFAVFLASLIYGVFAFAGNRWVHLAQLVELPCAAFILLIGSMTIGHDWL